MPNKVVIFPTAKRAEADAYAAACTEYWAANYEPGGTFGYVRVDAAGSWVCPYFGPPFFLTEGEPIPEPEVLIPLRAEGAIEDAPVWPGGE